MSAKGRKFAHEWSHTTKVNENTVKCKRCDNEISAKAKIERIRNHLSKCTKSPDNAVIDVDDPNGNGSLSSPAKKQRLWQSTYYHL